jgi:hypothetical protein
VRLADLHVGLLASWSTVFSRHENFRWGSSLHVTLKTTDQMLYNNPPSPLTMRSVYSNSESVSNKHSCILPSPWDASWTPRLVVSILWFKDYTFALWLKDAFSQGVSLACQCGAFLSWRSEFIDHRALYNAKRFTTACTCKEISLSNVRDASTSRLWIKTLMFLGGGGGFCGICGCKVPKFCRKWWLIRNKF